MSLLVLNLTKSFPKKKKKKKVPLFWICYDFQVSDHVSHSKHFLVAEGPMCLIHFRWTYGILLMGSSTLQWQPCLCPLQFAKARIDWKKTPFSMLQSAVEANVYRGESEVLALRRESTRFSCYIIWFFMYCYHPKDLTVYFQLNRNGIFVEAFFFKICRLKYF